MTNLKNLEVDENLPTLLTKSQKEGILVPLINGKLDWTEFERWYEEYIKEKTNYQSNFKRN